MITILRRKRSSLRTYTRPRRQQEMAPYLFLTPAALFFTVFFVLPVLFSFYLSFNDWNMIAPMKDMKFEGLGNYTALIHDKRFLVAFLNTLEYALGCLIFIPPISLCVALMLNYVKRGNWFWRTVYFLPVITSIVAMSTVWSYIFDPTYGPLNEILKTLHLPALGWTSSTKESLLSVVIVTVWQYTGYYAIIYLAGVQGIPGDYYEAAEIDGAGSWRKFWFITVPLLKQTSVFVFVMVAINSLQVFTQIFMITGGGPNDSSNVIVLYLYQVAFQFLHMGSASAMAMVLFVVVLVVTLIQLKLLRADKSDGEMT